MANDHRRSLSLLAQSHYITSEEREALVWALTEIESLQKGAHSKFEASGTRDRLSRLETDIATLRGHKLRLFAVVDRLSSMISHLGYVIPSDAQDLPPRNSI
jgi:hypothetical protein